MKRRRFLGRTFAGGAWLGGGIGLGGGIPGVASQLQASLPPGDLAVERGLPGLPHKGKVLAAIQPHADDIPLFARGTVAKLIREDYTGYLIRTTNDGHAGPGTVGDTVVANDEAADREYVRRFMISSYQKLGARYDLGCAEAFYYMDQRVPDGQAGIDRYVSENAVLL